MAYPYFNPYYPQPMPDNLMQMRQMQQPQMQPMQQPIPQPVQQNPIAQGGVQWVSGEQEARGYLIAPNSAVALWDSTAPTVYLKQADASGKPTLKIYDLVERAETPRTAPQEKGVEFVTREEFDRLAALDADAADIEGKKTRKVEADVADNESVHGRAGRRAGAYG